MIKRLFTIIFSIVLICFLSLIIIISVARKNIVNKDTISEELSATKLPESSSNDKSKFYSSSDELVYAKSRKDGLLTNTNTKKKNHNNSKLTNTKFHNEIANRGVRTSTDALKAETGKTNNGDCNISNSKNNISISSNVVYSNINSTIAQNYKDIDYNTCLKETKRLQQETLRFYEPLVSSSLKKR